MEKNKCEFIVFPHKEPDEEGNKLFAFAKPIIRINNVIGSPISFHEQYNSYVDDDENVGTSNVIELKPQGIDSVVKEKLDQMPQQNIGIVKREIGGKFDVDSFESVSKETVAGFVCKALVPTMKVDEDLTKTAQLVYTKFENIFETAMRLLKKSGKRITGYINSIIDYGVSSSVDEAFSKFCKDHKSVLKSKNQLVIITDPNYSTAFRICSYLEEKGYDLVLVSEANGSFKIATPPINLLKSYDGPFDWKDKIEIATSLFLACIQEGVGVYNNSAKEGNIDNYWLDTHIATAFLQNFVISADEIDEVVKIYKKIKSGTFKFTLYPVKDGLSVNNDGLFKISGFRITRFKKETGDK